MRGMFGVIASVALTVGAWGVYGPVLHNGQYALGGGPGEPSRWRPFICVGVAYFVVAIVVPGVLLITRGEKGHFSGKGIITSLFAGALGAGGALGIISAFNFGGAPIFVMPLVFGGAPVINTFVTMWLTRTHREAGPIFFAGLILVIAGAVCVMIFKPTAVVEPAAAGEVASAGEAVVHFALVLLSVGATALCWGTYGSMLHRGQAAMGGSRMRPFMCVGVAYFLIAVMIPSAILAANPEPGGWNVSGALWSLGGGTAGALGALGIIMSFTFGGRPVYVMPLVFGGAPVINTLVTVLAQLRAGKTLVTNPLFYAGLILVIVGAVTVLVFAPRSQKKPATQPKADKPRPAEEKAPVS